MRAISAKSRRFAVWKSIDWWADGLYTPVLNQGLIIRFDLKEFPRLTQWKMMGQGEYVLGLGPGN